MRISRGKRILITGPPGSGKTYVSSKLQENGINAVDADKVPNLGRWVDKKGKEVEFRKDADRTWLSEHDYIWDKKVLEEYLLYGGENDMLFLGISANVYDLLDLFDLKFFLKPTSKLLRKRFSEPSRKNPMGRTKDQLNAIVESIKYHTKVAKKLGFLAVDASRSPNEIYEEIHTKIKETFAEPEIEVQMRDGKSYNVSNFFYHFNPYITRKQEKVLRSEFKKKIRNLQKETRLRESKQRGVYEKHLKNTQETADLKLDEEQQLVKVMMEGNYWGIEENARGKILEANKKYFLPIAHAVAKKFTYNTDYPDYSMSSVYPELTGKEINPFYTTWEATKLLEEALPGITFEWARYGNDKGLFRDYLKNNKFARSWSEGVLKDTVNKKNQLLKEELLLKLFNIYDPMAHIVDC